MKKFFLPFLLGSLLLSGCRSPEESLSIWIASDLHYLDSSLETDTGAYQTKNLTSDGRIQENDEMYLSIFLDEIQKKQPKILVLSGDLTFNGEKASHLALQKKLKQIEETTQVLVIPGNHDLLNPHAYDFSAPDQIKEAESITYEEFRTIYHDFGYAQAKECDSSSLSYVYEATPKVWMLMLDSSCSYKNDGVFMYNEGDFKKQTLSWIERVLQKAKEQNAMVIPVSHHNLNCHNPMFSTGYQIINEYALKLLYEKYGIPVHFSGHMHIQHVEKSPVVYDICTSSLLDYGNRYGKITLNGNQLHYVSQALPLSKEVKKESFDCFYQCYYDKVYARFSKIDGVDCPEEIAKLYATANNYYFDGDQEGIHRLNVEYASLIQWMKDTFSDYEESYYATLLKEETRSMQKLDVSYPFLSKQK